MSKPHKIEKRYTSSQSMDCIGWHNVCSCGKKLFGWTKIEVEKEAKNHIEESKTSLKK